MTPTEFVMDVIIARGWRNGYLIPLVEHLRLTGGVDAAFLNKEWRKKWKYEQRSK